MIGDLLCDLNIFNESLSLIGVEAGRIDLYLEAEAVDDMDLSGWQCVQLGHALDLHELHVVAVLELVSLILVHGDNARISLGRCHHDEGLSVLAVRVSDTEIVAVVQEGETLGTVGLREDEAYVLGADELINFDHLINAVENLSVGNNMEISVVFKSKA